MHHCTWTAFVCSPKLPTACEAVPLFLTTLACLERSKLPKSQAQLAQSTQSTTTAATDLNVDADLEERNANGSGTRFAAVAIVALLRYLIHIMH